MYDVEGEAYHARIHLRLYYIYIFSSSLMTVPPRYFSGRQTSDRIRSTLRTARRRT